MQWHKIVEPSIRQLAVKTAVDRVGAAGLLLLLSPLFAVVAVLIRCNDKGPVFFRQERNGSDGTSFPMLKFRTILIGAEAMLPSLLDRSGGICGVLRLT